MITKRDFILRDSHFCEKYSITRINLILLTKTTAAKNEVTLSYHRVRGLCFPAVVFVAAIVYRSININ